MRRTLLVAMVAALLLVGMPVAASAEAPAVELPTTMAVAAAWGLRLRVEPGLVSETLLVMDCSEQVTIIGGIAGAITKNGYRWVQVSVNRDGRDVLGYAALKYLTADLTPHCYLVSWVTKQGGEDHGGGEDHQGGGGGGH